MIITLLVLLGVMVVAVGTTVVAIARAKDGYEDELGFHSSGLAQAADARNEPASTGHLPGMTGDRTVTPEPVLATAP